MDFFIPILVAFLFTLAKTFEMKYIEKEAKPLKYIIRDALIVFLITAIVFFIYMNFSNKIYEFFNIVLDNKTMPISMNQAPEIFTDMPEF